MKKTISKVRFDDKQLRWKTKIISDPCHPDTFEGRAMLAELLHAIADQPDLVACGGQRFDTLKISHDTNAWVFEADAIVPTDGREVKATVPPFMKEGDDIKVVRVEVTTPKTLPDSMRWNKDEDRGLEGLMDGEEMMPWTRS